MTAAAQDSQNEHKWGTTKEGTEGTKRAQEGAKRAHPEALLQERAGLPLRHVLPMLLAEQRPRQMRPEPCRKIRHALFRGGVKGIEREWWPLHGGKFFVHRGEYKASRMVAAPRNHQL